MKQFDLGDHIAFNLFERIIQRVVNFLKKELLLLEQRSLGEPKTQKAFFISLLPPQESETTCCYASASIHQILNNKIQLELSPQGHMRPYTYLKRRLIKFSYSLLPHTQATAKSASATCHNVPRALK